MSEDKKKKVKKKKRFRFFKTLFSFLLILILAGGIAASVFVYKAVADTPEIDPTNINELLNQTSNILDQNGELIEKIQTEEYRTIVSLDRIPKDLQNAFIAIEDERFENHIGVDLKGILSSLLDNFKAGKTVRGASTITQQLSRNLYLTNEVKLERKIKEAFISLKLERVLTKDQILEAYLNRIYLGQGAYGVQAAAQTYFNKNVEDLNLAESATIAAIVQSPTNYSVYLTVKAENFDPEKYQEVGRLDILGEKYIAIYNPVVVNRQKIVLAKMLELGSINESQYKDALNVNIQESIVITEKNITDITSYFNDYIKTEVVNALIAQGYSEDEAQKTLYGGGLKIYSTMDLNLQRKLEDIYDNFTGVLFGDTSYINGPVFVDWRLNGGGNIVDENSSVIFYKRGNILTEKDQLIIAPGSYELNENGVVINNNILRPYQNLITIKDYYTIDGKKNLVTHDAGNINIGEDNYNINEGIITIKKSFLDGNPNFYEISENGSLLINSDYFTHDKEGVVQPQSASVVIDYRNGHIKALVGGRDVKGSRILNRAIKPRQPGSSIKPIAAYLPALASGYTAASVIDDVPMMKDGKPWPRNAYGSYRGLTTMRRAIENSVNTTAVKIVDLIGIDKSVEFLGKMGIINKNYPDRDTFVSSYENNSINDENLSSMGLGGMSHGITPLNLTGAYASIANDGMYLSPISFTKVLDSNNKVIIDNTPNSEMVVPQDVAFVMKDMLRTTVTNGIAGRAQIPNMTTAGKTGTTEEQADAWFAGFTPYYVMSTWIGNDIPQIKLNKGSSMAAELWRIIMTSLHEGLENKYFEKPEGIMSLSVCSKSGKLPTAACAGNTITEYFASGTQPKELCDGHTTVNICTVSNKIAGEFCPDEDIVTKSNVKRTEPYNPAEHGGVTPEDYQSTAPSALCDVHNEKSFLDRIKDLLEGETEDEEENEENTEDSQDYIDENTEDNTENNDDTTEENTEDNDE